MGSVQPKHGAHLPYGSVPTHSPCAQHQRRWTAQGALRHYWFVNRKKDIKDGKTNHVYANLLDTKMRESLERLWKCRAHRGLRHGWGLRVRGQKTCTTGRHGKTVGVARKKGQ